MCVSSKVTGSVSSKTSYVVLGSDAGPKKLDMIKKNNIKTLDEDAFLNLIATRSVEVVSYVLKSKGRKVRAEELRTWTKSTSKSRRRMILK